MNQEFKNQLFSLKVKLDEISKLPNADVGQDFIGLDFDEHLIYYKTETYYRGCGTESCCIEVSWDEINEPIEYFEDKFKKEFEAMEARRMQEQIKEEEGRREKEIAEMKRIQAKYGIV